MASRRSPAAFHSIMLSYTRVQQDWWYIVYVALVSAVSRWDTYLSETHCKLRRSAAVGKQRRSHSLLVPRSGTYVLSLISSWICQSRFAELFGEGWLSFVPTAALLRSLQWVSDGRSRFAEPCCLCSWARAMHK